MTRLVERFKQTVQRSVLDQSASQGARLEAAARLRETLKELGQETARIAAVNQREVELSAAIALLEAEEVEAKKVKERVLAEYAAGTATEQELAAVRERCHGIATRLGDRQEMYGAVTHELAASEAERPPSTLKKLEERKSADTRVFWMAVFEEIKTTEAPPHVHEWIRRCWATYRVAGFGGVPGMFASMFPKEFPNIEMEELRQQMERQFLEDQEKA